MGYNSKKVLKLKYYPIISLILTLSLSNLTNTKCYGFLFTLYLQILFQEPALLDENQEAPQKREEGKEREEEGEEGKEKGEDEVEEQREEEEAEGEKEEV